MPAELIRPKAPAAGKRIFLEHIGFLWKRMKFLHKVTARNVFRFKKRMLMMKKQVLKVVNVMIFMVMVMENRNRLIKKYIWHCNN